VGAWTNQVKTQTYVSFTYNRAGGLVSLGEFARVSPPSPFASQQGRPKDERGLHWLCRAAVQGRAWQSQRHPPAVRGQHPHTVQVGGHGVSEEHPVHCAEYPQEGLDLRALVTACFLALCGVVWAATVKSGSFQEEARQERQDDTG
jgi:hypothetical protein